MKAIGKRSNERITGARQPCRTAFAPGARTVARTRTAGPADRPSSSLQSSSISPVAILISIVVVLLLICGVEGSTADRPGEWSPADSQAGRA